MSLCTLFRPYLLHLVYPQTERRNRTVFFPPFCYLLDVVSWIKVLSEEGPFEITGLCVIG